MAHALDRITLSPKLTSRFQDFIGGISITLQKHGIDISSFPEWQAELVDGGRLIIFVAFKEANAAGRIEFFVSASEWRWNDQN